MAVVASYTRRHQRLRQGTDEANERQQKRTPEKNGRGRAALTRSNWGRSTFRASWKLWAPATLVRETFFDHAAETLTQYTSKAAHSKDALASPCCKGLSSGTAARKASRRSTEMRGLTTALDGAGAGAFGWNHEKTRWTHDGPSGASSFSATPSNRSKAAEAAKTPTPAIPPRSSRPHPNNAMAPSSP